MIDFRCEELMTLGQAANSLPGRVHASSVFRWARRGVRGTRLETIVVGGRRYTSTEAIAKFIAATTAARNDGAVRGYTPRQREQDIAAAELELGIEPRETREN